MQSKKAVAHKVAQGKTSESSNNLRRVKEIYAAFGRGDIETVLKGLSEDIDWYVPGPKQIPYAGHRRGRQQVAQFFKILGETTEINPFETREYFAQGDRVIVVGYYAGRVKETGKEFQEDWVMTWTFKNGQAVKFQEYMDPTNLIAAFAPAEAAAWR